MRRLQLSSLLFALSRGPLLAVILASMVSMVVMLFLFQEARAQPAHRGTVHFPRACRPHPAGNTGKTPPASIQQAHIRRLAAVHFADRIRDFVERAGGAVVA